MAVTVSPHDAVPLDDLLEDLRARPPRSKAELHLRKLAFARARGLMGLPRDTDLLARADPGSRPVLEDLLRVKPGRTASGVAVVTVMTAPHPCPHGTCVFCPGGPRFGTPQSYTGRESVAVQAAGARYDPARQVAARLEALRRIGHRTDKVDLIVLGGTFTAFRTEYRESFVKGCLDAMNGRVAPDLAAAQAANETARARCVGLTVETKPDCFLGEEVEHAVRLGTTRIELGLQSTHDDVLEAAHRGHTDAQSRGSIRRAKDTGLKVGVHMMPGLPGSDPDRDLASLRALFEDPAYRPDFLKIYPTLVLEGTALYGMWRAGRYRPLGLEEAVDIVARAKESVPRWCRIQRIQREIGAPWIAGGPTKGDLRILARERLAARGLACRCIRCREVGFRGAEPRPTALALLREDYEASGGHEVFLSVEDPGRDVLVGYARMRVDRAGATVRELKVFGPLVPIHERVADGWQHRGCGRRLMAACERIAREEFGASRIRVTSGVGVRGYYRRLGYSLDGAYMVKRLGVTSPL